MIAVARLNWLYWSWGALWQGAHMAWEGARHPVVVAIVSVWAARLWSHVEHRGTSRKIKEIHGQLNGGLTERIRQEVREAMEEKE